MATFMDTVCQYLIDSGAGAGGFATYVGFMADQPDTAIGLAPTGGFPQDTLGNENVSGSFQVKIRAGEMDYDAAVSKWNTVFALLQDAVDIPGVVFIQALAAEPMVLYDGRNRPCAILNMRYTRTR